MCPQRAIECDNAAHFGPYRPFWTPERISIPDDIEECRRQDDDSREFIMAAARGLPYR